MDLMPKRVVVSGTYYGFNAGIIPPAMSDRIFHNLCEAKGSRAYQLNFVPSTSVSFFLLDTIPTTVVKDLKFKLETGNDAHRFVKVI